MALSTIKVPREQSNNLIAANYCNFGVDQFVNCSNKL